jgi:hypothetical protein
LLTSLPDTGRAIAFLVEVARSNDLAVSAVHYLSMDTGEAGERALRRLYETDAVVDPGAREMLFAIASGRGWKR